MEADLVFVCIGMKTNSSAYSEAFSKIHQYYTSDPERCIPKLYSKILNSQLTIILHYVKLVFQKQKTPCYPDVGIAHSGTYLRVITINYDKAEITTSFLK